MATVKNDLIFFPSPKKIIKNLVGMSPSEARPDLLIGLDYSTSQFLSFFVALHNGLESILEIITD